MFIKLRAVELQIAWTPGCLLADVANCHRYLVVLKLEEGLSFWRIGIDVSTYVLQVSHVSVHVQYESTVGVIIVIKVFVIDIRSHI